MEKKGRNYISYNFMVSLAGESFEARGWGIKGSHSIPYNNRSMGICVIGNYMSKYIRKREQNRLPNTFLPLITGTHIYIHLQ